MIHLIHMEFTTGDHQEATTRRARTAAPAPTAGHGGDVRPASEVWREGSLVRCGMRETDLEEGWR